MAYTLKQHQRQMAATRRAIAKQEERKAARQKRFRAAAAKVSAAHDRMEEALRRHGADSPAYRLARRRWLAGGEKVIQRFGIKL